MTAMSLSFLIEMAGWHGFSVVRENGCIYVCLGIVRLGVGLRIERFHEKRGARV